MTAADALATVRDWIRWCCTRLSRAPLHYGHGTDDPWDEAIALVADHLRIPRDRLGEMLDARVLAEEGEALAGLLARRIDERVPVPYLTGLAWQAGLAFEVDARVLVPRSPIAGLLAEGLEPWLGGRSPRRILDLCTGSGCLGLIAAQVFPDAAVVLADIDADALAVAERNRARHDPDGRVSIVRSDGLAGLVDAEPFDLVLCNPPYVDDEDLAAVPAEFAHEPRIALAGGADGLDLVARFLAALPAHVDLEGLLVLEVGNSAAALERRFPGLPWIWPDLEAGGHGVALLETDALLRG